MAESLDDNNEAYIVANFARWAGDVGYALVRLREVVPPERRDIAGYTRQQLESSDVGSSVEARLGERRERRDVGELIEAASEEQYRRLANLLKVRGEHDLPALPASGELDETSLPPSNVIAGVVLRAVVEPVSSHEYQMRAFLTKLAWELEFFKRVEDQVRLHRGKRTRGSGEAIRGGTWFIEGDLFLEVTVDDFGLIECRGTWTKRDPPDATVIFEALRQVLRPLDR